MLLLHSLFDTSIDHFINVCFSEYWHRLALKLVYFTANGHAEVVALWHTDRHFTSSSKCLLSRERERESTQRRWRLAGRPLTHCRQQTMSNCSLLLPLRRPPRPPSLRLRELSPLSTLGNLTFAYIHQGWFLRPSRIYFCFVFTLLFLFTARHASNEVCLETR